MITKNFKLPNCNQCKEWPWCSNIPNDCRKGIEVATVLIKLEDEIIHGFDFDFSEDEPQEYRVQAAEEYVFGNITVEVINGRRKI